MDHRGAEGQLQAAYLEAVQRLPALAAQVRYEPFDFHAECRKMRWDRLSILMDRVAIDQDEMGFFLLLRDGSQALQQDGVFRTNCIDCLDRTNVVQSMLARRCLTAMLRKMSILGHEQVRNATFCPVRRTVTFSFFNLVSGPSGGAGPVVQARVGGQRRRHQHAVLGHRRVEDRLHAHRKANPRRPNSRRHQLSGTLLQE